MISIKDIDDTELENGVTAAAAARGIPLSEFLTELVLGALAPFRGVQRRVLSAKLDRLVEADLLEVAALVDTKIGTIAEAVEVVKP